MNKKLILVFTVLVLSTCLVFMSNEEKVVLSNKDSNNIMVNSNALTMMYETGYQSGEYQVSSDTSWPQSGYTFNEDLSKCENGGTLTWNDESKKVLMQANTSDKCYMYFDKNPITLANHIINNVYTGTDGDNGLYYHDGQGTYTNANQEAEDNSYRFAGANPNNYVCFGSDEAICSDDNLYRVIGVFDNLVKLIKYDYTMTVQLGNDGSFSALYTDSAVASSSYYKGSNYNNIASYYWNNSTGVNTWSESNLNIVNLNINFLNNIGVEWSDKILETDWIVGGNTYQNIREMAVKTIYANEIISPSTNTKYNAKVGLMYVSDYGYAASPAYWNTKLSSYSSARLNNWMHMGLFEWTLTRVSGHSYGDIYSFFLNDNGSLDFSNPVNNYPGFAVRPTFYLKSNVVLTGGTGTQSDPYRIA